MVNYTMQSVCSAQIRSGPVAVCDDKISFGSHTNERLESPPGWYLLDESDLNFTMMRLLMQFIAAHAPTRTYKTLSTQASVCREKSSLHSYAFQCDTRLLTSLCQWHED